MSFAKTHTAQINLLRGQIVTVEVDISRGGLHSFSIVGLPDKAIDESKDRVSMALKNSGYKSPKNTNAKIVVSLSPADLKKEGSLFDLSIALGYLMSSGEIKFDSENKIFIGELSLNGELKPVKGILPLVEEAKRKGFEEVYLPEGNETEAGLVEGISIYKVKNLKQIVQHLSKTKDENGNIIFSLKAEPKTIIEIIPKINTANFRDIRGQESAKRGLEIAAAGGHNIAMWGPPGTGKTMLARAFSTILPNLSNEEILEITGIHSIVGTNEGELVTHPPFRAPHHTSSYVSLIGGGTFPKPGEVTLAHRGVLFLDELPEFEKRVIESLRQPLEDNIVSISRAKGTAIFPSNFILVAAMNPCPCGNLGSKQKPCTCKPFDVERYKKKLSGPIIDRIDMWVSVGAIDYAKLGGEENYGEDSSTIKERVLRARTKQIERFKKHFREIKQNSEMNVRDLTALIKLDEETRKILDESAERLMLSARAYHRIQKLARTIADLDGSEQISKNHILEALQYRPREFS